MRQIDRAGTEATRWWLLAWLLAGLLIGAGPAQGESEIVVGTINGVQIFSRTATGDATPIRTLRNAGTGGVAVDSTNHEIFASDGNNKAIRVFARTASGNVAPVRVIQGALTGLKAPFGLFVDTVHDELFVADGGNDTVLVFPRTAHGNVAPIRRIENHTLDANGFFAQLTVFVDLAHDEVLVAGTKLATDAVLVYPRLANGTNVLPIREIPVGFNNFAEGMFVNQAADELVVTSGKTDGEVRFYSRTANSPITTTMQIPAGLPPLRTIKGAATGLNKAVGLDIDLANGELFVTSSANASVRVFPLSASGNVSPSRVIAGPSTGLGSAQLMVLGTIPSGLPAPLLASVLPVSRSVKTGTTATAFATIINSGPAALSNCEIAPLNGPSAGTLGYLFQTTNPATNEAVGLPNAPVSIPGNSLRTFVFAFTPTVAFAPLEIQLAFQCAGAALAPITIGLDTFLLSASSSAVPDVIALAATATGNGIADIPGATGTGAFAVATANVGAGGLITVTPDTGTASLPVGLAVCQTNPTTGECTTPIGPSVTTQIDAGQTPTFTVFVTGLGSVAFDPASHRVFLRFKDQGDIIRGATSVATRTVEIVAARQGPEAL